MEDELYTNGDEELDRYYSASLIQKANFPVDKMDKSTLVRQYDEESKSDKLFMPLDTGGYTSVGNAPAEMIQMPASSKQMAFPIPKNRRGNGLQAYYDDLGSAVKTVADPIITGVAQGVDRFTDTASDFLGKYIQFKLDPNLFDGQAFPEINPKEIIMDATGFEGIDVSMFEPDTKPGMMAKELISYVVGYSLTPGGPLGSAGKVAMKDAGAMMSEGPYIGNIFEVAAALGLENEITSYLSASIENPDDATLDERLASRIKATTDIPLLAGVVFAAVKILGNKAFQLAAGGLTGTALTAQEAEGSPLGTFVSQTLKRLERSKINEASINPKQAKIVKEETLRIKNEYPPEDGWLPISLNTDSNLPVFKVKKDGSFDLRWSQPSYAFHIPPGSKKDSASVLKHQNNLASRMYDDVLGVVERAKTGDQAAIDIIAQANWYRSMRSRLRKEFGGMADVFADIIGATSAQTNVQQNYENSLNVLRRFSRGEFDNEIAMYSQKVEAGESLSSKDLAILHKDENSPFRLITKAGGELFNTNSPAATQALLDMFRQIKKGSSPKTKNFTGNLIGFGNDATVDVWAARYLRDASGLPRIPPPVEKAVAGNHLTGSTLENPIIGSEFGFGQKVFSEAADAINQSGMIQQVDPSLGDLGPDDLQAVVWFLEKEKWTKNGWTTKAGEGGSLDFESVYGGSSDFSRTKELRSIINSVNSNPEQIAAAKAELKTLEGAPQRMVGGVAMERPDAVPSNVQQANLAAELTAPLVDDPTAIGYQINNTLGEFMGDTERSLNFEIVTQTDFDPTAVTRSLVEAGKKNNQDSVFISKVVDPTVSGARPGVEIYFKNRTDVAGTQALTKKVTDLLRDRDLVGFTFITDARQGDRVDVQALTKNQGQQTAGINGIRFQYIPEFDPNFDPANASEIFRQKADLYLEITEEMINVEGVTYADTVYYDTQVFKNEGMDYINGGTSYDEYLSSSQ